MISSTLQYYHRFIQMCERKDFLFHRVNITTIKYFEIVLA